MPKSERLTNANRAEHENRAREYYALKREQGSTGVDASLREVDIRAMLNINGITTSGGLYIHKRYMADIRTKDKRGEWVRLEVKHGGGALAYAPDELTPFTERTRDLCLVDADWIIYNESATLTDKRQMLKVYRVCKREDFLDMLEEYCHGPKSAGFQTATKFSKGGIQINIQSKYTTQFWNGLKDDPRTMSLWEFCYTVLGRKPHLD